jgi:branched-chain amino acid transport system ATP-binding protein
MVKAARLSPWPRIDIALSGHRLLPRERGIFASLTAEENLLLPPAVASGGMSVDEIIRDVSEL